MSSVRHAVGIITGPKSWAETSGRRNPDVSKAISVSVILTTLSPTTTQVCVSVCGSDSVVSAAALRCTGLQTERDTGPGAHPASWTMGNGSFPG